MNKPLRFALNRMVAPRLSLPEFIDLALALKTDAIEIRNDLKGVEIEDGIRDQPRSRGLGDVYKRQGMLNSGPLAMLSGQRCITLL